MLDNILDTVKQYAKEAVQGSSDIADDKKDLAFQTTASTLVDGIKDFFAEGDFISKITELFSENGGSLFDKLKGNLSSALTDKVGLDASAASGFAASVLPSIKQAISDKANSFSIDGIVNAITGKNGEKDGGIIDTISDFFKK